MVATKKILILIFTTVGVLVGASFFVTAPADTDASLFHTSFALNIAMAVLFIGGAVLYLQGLEGFTKKLRRSYILLCVGLGLFGLAQVQLPLTTLLGVQDEYWYSSGLQPLVFAGGVFFIFAGTRAFAKLFSIRNLSTSWLFGIGLYTALGLLLYAVSHGPLTISTEAQFDANNIAILLPTVFLGLSTLQLLQIKRVANTVYNNPLAWLIISFGICIASALYFISFRIALGENALFLDINPLVIGVIFSISGLCLVRAAYGFSLIKEAAIIDMPAAPRSFFGTPLQPSVGKAANSIDIITFTANLASDSRAIDPMLDPVRVITSRSAAHDNLTKADQLTLQQVYLQLEDYLLRKERVRDFKKDSLRHMIAHRLHLQNTTSTFWSQLPPPRA